MGLIILEELWTHQVSRQSKLHYTVFLWNGNLDTSVIHLWKPPKTTLRYPETIETNLKPIEASKDHRKLISNSFGSLWNPLQTHENDLEFSGTSFKPLGTVSKPQINLLKPSETPWNLCDHLFRTAFPSGNLSPSETLWSLPENFWTSLNVLAHPWDPWEKSRQLSYTPCHSLKHLSTAWNPTETPLGSP